MAKFKNFTILVNIVYILYLPYLILHQVSSSPPLFPEEDTGLGFLDKIYDARRQIIKPQKHTSEMNRTVEAKEYFISSQIILKDGDDEGKHFTAPSSIKILVTCIQKTNIVSLNAYMKDSIIVIKKETVKIVNQNTLEEISVSDGTFEDYDELYQISLATPLEKGGEYMISMDYTSTILNPDEYLDGLYYSHYKDKEETKYIAVTQFESEGARKMYPCIDQPDNKAKFTISIGRLEKYNSLSNMQIVKTEPMEGNPGWYWDHFATTPLMSTYLMAVVISEYDCSTAAPELFHNKEVQVCASKAEIARGGGVYGAERAARLLSFYEDYLEYEYSLPKMVSASIRHFAAGAMENWGLNTYRTAALLYYPDVSSEAQREGITSIIAHELAHQWFGNLVTCRSWNQIWLNEGFATYIQYIGMQAINPEFSHDIAWYTDAFQRALSVDQKSASHPLVNTSQSFGHFDTVTYQKGASLIHMMNFILTPQTFHSGLKRYLRENAFGNTDQWDLFSTLEDEAIARGTHPGINLTDIMDTWTLKAGYPVIFVSKSSSPTGYYISQSRFISDSARSAEDNEVDVTEPARNSWWVNIHPVTSYDPDFTPKRSTVWLSPAHATLLYTTKKESDWMVLNGGSVFGRVLYDDVTSSNIARQLNENYNTISPINRAQLLEDYFTFAHAKQHNVAIGDALQFTKYLAEEHEKIVWTTAMNHLRKPYLLLSSSESSFALFKKYFTPLFAGALHKIGLGSTRGKNVTLGANLVNWLVAMEHQGTLDYTSNVVNEWKNQADYKENNIPVDFRPICFCGAVANGNKEIFDFIWERSKDVDDANHNLLVSLACTKDEEQIRSLLQTLIDPESGLSTYGATLVIRKLAENTVARDMTFQFLQNNFNKTYEHFGDTKPFSVFISTVSRTWSHPEDLQRLTDFGDMHSEKLKPMEKILTASKTTIEDNMQWMKSFKSHMDQWFLAALTIGNGVEIKEKQYNNAVQLS